MALLDVCGVRYRPCSTRVGEILLCLPAKAKYCMFVDSNVAVHHLFVTWVIALAVLVREILVSTPRKIFFYSGSTEEENIGLRVDETVKVYSFRCAPVAFTPSASLQSPPLVSFVSFARKCRRRVLRPKQKIGKRRV